MIRFLFTIVFAQVAVIVTLMFNSPLRKLVVMVLDQLKQGKGPVVVKTVAATMVMVFMSNIYSLLKVQNHIKDGGGVNPTDQVLMAYHLLEASLMGFSLFLALMVDRLHYYIHELHRLRNSLEDIKNLKEGHERKSRGEKERKAAASEDGIYPYPVGREEEPAKAGSEEEVPTRSSGVKWP